MKLFPAYEPAPWHQRLRRILWWLFVVPRKYKAFIPPWGALKLSKRDMARAQELATRLDSEKKEGK